jgi:hypothetical protein
MKWEYLSAGLGLVAFGVAVALALPPPSRPDMLPIFVGLGVLAGSALILLGLVMTWMGIRKPQRKSRN